MKNLTGISISALFIAACTSETETKITPPNIVVIMADDMAYSDIGCYGGEIPTPNIDNLASNGMRFTQFYNGGRCCPTRASLLTGLYAHQAGVGSMVNPTDRPGYLGRLNDQCATFAEVLRTAGYQTFMSGKWHVTHYDYSHDESKLHRDSWPMQRGFDRFFGTLSGAGSYFSPASLMMDNTFIEPEGDFYYTDKISEYAVKFIEEADKNKPLLLYVAHVAPHWPLHARPEEIEKFKSVYDMGWDKLRDERYKRMKDAGIIDPQWPLTSRDEDVPAWDDAPNKEWESHRMAVYATQVYRMDHGIGRIVETLKQTGRYENTLIVFLADNGGCAEIIQGKETRHGFYSQGGTTPEVFPGGPDTYASYGVGWANAGNTPFRLYKKWMHEGGIATPFVAHWPAVIKGNQITKQTGHIIDILPTLAEAAGASYPETLNGRELTPLEGISLMPVFQGKKGKEHEALYWEHIGNKAVREGNWKLVSEKNGEWELYNMETDRTEMNNLLDTHPEIAKRLEDMWEKWAVRAKVK